MQGVCPRRGARLSKFCMAPDHQLHALHPSLYLSKPQFGFVWFFLVFNEQISFLEEF